MKHIILPCLHAHPHAPQSLDMHTGSKAVKTTTGREGTSNRHVLEQFKAVGELGRLSIEAFSEWHVLQPRCGLARSERVSMPRQVGHRCCAARHSSRPDSARNFPTAGPSMQPLLAGQCHPGWRLLGATALPVCSMLATLCPLPVTSASSAHRRRLRHLAFRIHQLDIGCVVDHLKDVPVGKPAIRKQQTGGLGSGMNGAQHPVFVPPLPLFVYQPFPWRPSPLWHVLEYVGMLGQELVIIVHSRIITGEPLQQVARPQEKGWRHVQLRRLQDHSTK